MLQSPLFDGVSLDPFSLQQDGLARERERGDIFEMPVFDRRRDIWLGLCVLITGQLDSQARELSTVDSERQRDARNRIMFASPGCFANSAAMMVLISAEN